MNHASIVTGSGACCASPSRSVAATTMPIPATTRSRRSEYPRWKMLGVRRNEVAASR